MTASAIGAEIADRHAKNEAEVAASYQALVRRVVNGKPPKPGQEMDDAIGLWQLKKVDEAQFERDCQHLRERLAWHSQLTGLQAAQDRQAAIEQERAALSEERKRFLIENDAKFSRLNDEHSQLSAKLSTGEHARDRLFNTFGDKIVLAHERTLSAKSVVLRDKIVDAQQRLAEQVVSPLSHARAALRRENDRIVSLRESGRDPRNAAKIATLTATIAHLEERERNDRSAISALVAQADQLQAELRDLARLHYEP